MNEFSAKVKAETYFIGICGDIVCRRVTVQMDAGCLFSLIIIRGR